MSGICLRNSSTRGKKKMESKMKTKKNIIKRKITNGEKIKGSKSRWKETWYFGDLTLYATACVDHC